MIERVRETVRTVIASGISAADLEARLALLSDQFNRQISATAGNAASQNAATYHVVAQSNKIDKLSGVDIDGGTISGATITGGSVTATAFSGVLAIASGGTGTSSTPTYGKVLLGNSSGTYDLVATSSLGISGSGGANFGQTFELTSGALSPTTTVGLIIAASSTFNGGVSIVRSTTTNATSTNLFATLGRFTSGIVDTLTATAATITSLTANTLTATNATTTRLDALDYVAVGRTATTTIRGDGVASTLPYASTTMVTATTASTSNLIVSNTFTFGLFTGFLKATAGVISTALVDLASNVTGILAVANGGTGWGAIQANTIVLGNGTGSLATTSAGTNGQVLALVSGTPTWVATTTLATISGTLGVGSGGTGLTSVTANQLLVGNTGGSGWTQIATSSLNLNTDNLVEGSNNLFFTNARVQSFVHSSTTIPKTYTDNTFTGSNVFSGALTFSGWTYPGFVDS